MVTIPKTIHPRNDQRIPLMILVDELAYISRTALGSWSILSMLVEKSWTYTLTESTI